MSTLLRRLVKPDAILDKSELFQCIRQAAQTIDLYRTRSLAPGLVFGVANRGRLLWTSGVGYADLENGTKCTDETVMRISSISKSIIMLLLGKLLEEGRVNLDKPINQYLGKD